MAIEKKQWRKDVSKLIQTCKEDQLAFFSRAICQSLRSRIVERKPSTIHTFFPIPGEPDLWPVIKELTESNTFTLITSKILDAGILEHFEVKDLSSLNSGTFGIKYPSGGREYEGSYDLIIVPGVVFDRMGNRIGRGGGYYDRFLAKHPRAYKIGICFPLQMVENIKTEIHDVPVDEVIFK